MKQPPFSEVFEKDGPESILMNAIKIRDAET